MIPNWINWMLTIDHYKISPITCREITIESYKAKNLFKNHLGKSEREALLANLK